MAESGAAQLDSCAVRHARTLERYEILGVPIAFGPVPDALAEPVIDLPWLQASQAEAVLRVKDVAMFNVRDGRSVTVQMEPGASAEDLRVWLEGSVTALVLVQRGQFALHASCVRIGQRLVAVAGPSGVGKSTTACLLAEAGHPVMTDDVSVVVPVGERMVVSSAGRSMRLWPESVSRLGLDPDDGCPVTAQSEKLAYPITGDQADSELGAVIALRTRPGLSEPVAYPLRGVAATQVLSDDTYRPMLRRLRPQAYLRWVTAMAASVPVIRVDRPVGGWSGTAVAELICSVTVG